MIPQEQVQQDVLSLLEKYTGRTCVPSNTTHGKPPYPYISFSVINTQAQKGTYAKAIVQNEDGTEKEVLFKPAAQKWSFTSQSDDEAEAMGIALLVSDFFAESRRQELADKGIVVADVGAIVPRDTLLTIEYEYRKGLDVTLLLNNVIDDVITESIEHATLSSNAGEISVEKE